MEIIEYSNYSFIVPIEKISNEERNDYLSRVRDCLDDFVKKNCVSDISERPINYPLKALLYENNWMHMEFNIPVPMGSTTYCDVRYKVRLDEEPIPDKINIWSQKRVNRKFWVEYLKELWKEYL